MIDYKLVFATSIKERHEVLKDKYMPGNRECDLGLKKWNEGNSLISEAEFRNILNSFDLTEFDFSIGVKKLNYLDSDLLYKFIQQEPWYILHNRIMQESIVLGNERWEDGFAYFSRPYRVWISKSIKEYNQKIDYTISNKVVTSYIEGFLKEIIHIAKKTLIYDYKIEYKGKVGQDNMFLSYAQDRFENHKKFVSFFNDYPVLARILSERASFSLSNYKEFTKSIKECKNELIKKFNLQDNFSLENIEINNGDSHMEGREVIIFVLDKKKLVFKYKNLEIGEAFNKFLTQLEKIDNKLSFYKIKRIVKEEYTIEEYVEYRDCAKDKELMMFYKRFGQLLCIVYLLRGNDFHMENLIAYGDYPVLVDVETLFQNELSINDNGKAQYSYAEIINDSVLFSNMLPNVWTQKEENEFGDVSALSGDEQILIRKYNKIYLDKMGDIQIKYEKCQIEGAKNLPIYLGEKVSYKKYCTYIIVGFQEMFYIICKNKTKIINIIDRCFSSQMVRILFRRTQKYDEMLDYGHHPGYMNNYINREKLFYNLWSFANRNTHVVKYEIEDLLIEDIPIFYSCINSKNITTSRGIVLDMFYSKTSIDIVKDKCARINNKEYYLQKNLLKISLGLFKGETAALHIHGNNFDSISKAKDIADFICKKVIWGKSRDDFLITCYSVNHRKEWKMSILCKNVYDGLSGIYIFLYMLNFHFQNKQFQELLYVMDKTFFGKIQDIRDENQFKEYMSYLYLVCCKLEKVYSIKEVRVGKVLLEKMRMSYTNVILPDEWIFGKAALIKICIKFYKITSYNFSLEFAKKVACDISLDKDRDLSFAHGYSGIIFSLIGLVQILKKEEVDTYIQKIVYLHKKFMRQYSSLIRMDNSWCNGLVGIAYMEVRLCAINHLLKGYRWKIDRWIFDNIIAVVESQDCICHGQFGKYSLIKEINDMYPEIFQNSDALKLQYDYFNGKVGYYIRGMENEPELDYLTGLTGIGYEYLRQIDSSLPNILILE